jgi:golgi phosphoprotein 3
MQMHGPIVLYRDRGLHMCILAEDLLLLALDDDVGSVSWERVRLLPYGLGGALLMDLALRERIDSVDEQVLLSDPSPTGDALLDATLETIHSSRKPHNAKHWVKTLGGQKGLQEQLAHRLVARGILREQEHTFLWAFHSQRYPTSNPVPEATVRNRIRAVVLADAEPDSRTLLLLSLINACNLTDTVFTREEQKQATRRIKELVEGEQFGTAVGRAVTEVTAAIVAAVSASVLAPTTAGASH